MTLRELWSGDLNLPECFWHRLEARARADWRREHLRDLALERGSLDWYSRPRNRERYWELFARRKLVRQIAEAVKP